MEYTLSCAVTLVMMKPPMAKKGVKPSSTNVSLQSLTKPMTNPPTNVASHCSSKATLSPIPAWILPTSLCVCVGGGGQLLCKQYMTFICTWPLYMHMALCVFKVSVVLLIIVTIIILQYIRFLKSIPPPHTHPLTPHTHSPHTPPHTHPHSLC